MDIDMKNNRIDSETVMWLGFRDPVQPGKKISLHCRRCNIKNVRQSFLHKVSVHFDYLLEL